MNLLKPRTFFVLQNCSNMRQLFFLYVVSLLAITNVQAQDEATIEVAMTDETPTTSSSIDNVLHMPSNWHKLKNEKKIRFLFAAVERGDVFLAENMITDINLPYYKYNIEGETLLTSAIGAGQYEMVKWLSKDAVINLENKDGETPLTLAIKKQNPAITALILERAKANLPNKQDETPLLLAVSYGYGPGFIQKLINKGAQPNRLSNGVTPLSRAVDKENIPLAAMLVKKGADPSLANKDGDIPLYQAVSKDHAVLAGVLLHRSSSPDDDANWQTPVGETLLNIAVSHQNISLVRVLADAGADVNAMDYLENTPMHMAAERGMAEAVNILLTHDAYADLPNIMGTTPIMAAAQNGHTEIAALLAETGANPGQRDYAGIAANDYGNYQMHFSDPYMQSEVDFLMEEVDVD